jgi:biopolymer transport protein ExbD
MEFKKTKKMTQIFDTTSMVDVVFTLILFLMIGASFEKMSGLKLELPKAATDNISKEERSYKINIKSDGEIFIGVKNKKVSLNELKDELKNIKSKNPNMLMVIQADTKVMHGTVIKVMDLLKILDFKRIGVSTELEK